MTLVEWRGPTRPTSPEVVPLGALHASSSAMTFRRPLRVLMMYGTAAIPDWAGVGSFVVCLIFAVGAWVDLLKFRQATARALGIPIDWRHPPPPRTAEHYRAWCSKYGVQPHPFKSATEYDLRPRQRSGIPAPLASSAGSRNVFMANPSY